MLRTCLVVILQIGSTVTAISQETPRVQQAQRAGQGLVDKYGPDYPVGPDPHPEIAPKKRLARNPNDAFAIRAYGRELWLQFTSDAVAPPNVTPDQIEAASRKVDAFEQFLGGLPAGTPAAKAAIARALDQLKTCRQILAVHQSSLAELEQRLLQNPTDVVAIWSYRMKFTRQLGLLAPNDPENAAIRVVAIKRVIEQVADSVSKLVNQDASTERFELVKSQTAVASLELAIEQSLNNRAVIESLIGSKAAPLEVDAWVNGNPVSAEEMSNKVVLLNFCWATWGNWTDTLSQRIAWDQAHRDKGLVIINVTTYHNQRWNDQSKSPIRVNRRDAHVPEPEQRRAVAAFCLHNQLKFPIAIQTRKAFYDLCEAFGGAPQFVLLDRNHAIRLIRSSDESGTQKVTDALDELFRQRSH